MAPDDNKQRDIEAFKQKLLEKLDSFIQGKNPDQLSPWKLDYVEQKDTYYRISFKNSQGPKAREKSFKVTDPPLGLSDDEKLALRRFINEECATRGFTPYNPRAVGIDPEIIEQVRNGDPDAWRLYVNKHLPTVTRSVEKLLSARELKKPPVIWEGEDIALKSLFKLFSACNKEGGLKKETMPLSAVNLNVGTLVKGLSKKARRQSDGQVVKEYTRDAIQPEYDGRFEILQEQLPVIIETARRTMTPTQKNILNMIMEHESERKTGEENDKNLSQSKIAQESGVSPQAISGHFASIRRAIQEAALALGPDYEQTAGLINYLLPQPKREPDPRMF